MKVTPVQVVKNYTIELSAKELMTLMAIVEFAVHMKAYTHVPVAWGELHQDLRNV